MDVLQVGPTVRLGLLHTAAITARITLLGHPDPMKDVEQLLSWRRDQEEFLDFIHFMLQVAEVPDSDLIELDRIFEQGGSLWRATEHGLELRVDPLAVAAFEAATELEDAESAELMEAWTKAYGREPDPSDAWDHAIKAVEAVLIPVVVPTQAGAHVGHVIGQLDNQG